jgi:hypothetical protein
MRAKEFGDVLGGRSLLCCGAVKSDPGYAVYSDVQHTFDMPWRTYRLALRTWFLMEAHQEVPYAGCLSPEGRIQMA